jgi:DNA-binding NarL/FixJ family response regulator
MKFLVVDDHALIRDALCNVLRELDNSAEILEAGTCGQALELAQSHQDIDLILLDLQLPDRDGLEVLAELRTLYPATAVVMLSGFNDRETVTKALGAGALGFIPKTDSRRVLLGALRLILAGGIYIPPQVLDSAPAEDEILRPAVPLQARPTPAELGLTERQVEVLALMMQGRSNKMICRALDLAEPTVKNHVSAILKALNVTNRTEAVLAVAGLGWEIPRADR